VDFVCVDDDAVDELEKDCLEGDAVRPSELLNNETEPISLTLGSLQVNKS